MRQIVNILYAALAEGEQGSVTELTVSAELTVHPQAANQRMLSRAGRAQMADLHRVLFSRSLRSCFSQEAVNSPDGGGTGLTRHVTPYIIGHA